MYETIASPFNYGGLALKNRIIFAPTSLGLSQEEQVERLRRIAAGGCAMIIIGDVPVLPHGFGPSLYSRKGAAFYRAVTDAVHQEGAKVCAQLHQSDSNLKAMVKYLPGVLTKRISMEELRTLLNQEVGPYITSCPPKRWPGLRMRSAPRRSGRCSWALTWSRFMETGCAAVSAPRCSTIVRMIMAGAQRIGPGLLWKRCPPSGGGCRICPLILNWRYGRRSRAMEQPESWSQSCRSSFPCWSRLE